MNGTASHSAARPIKRFGQGQGQDRPAKLAPAQVPTEILQDEQLNAAVAAYLPSNYNFEIHKTVHHVRHYGSTCVALQMPEGLTLWATAISDIIERFTGATTVIMGDVTYGACCVDDFTARALGADMLVHYGHSCLVPVDQTSIRTLYVFVEIAVDPGHICSTIRANFPDTQHAFRRKVLQQSEPAHDKARLEIDLEEHSSAHRRPTHLALVATVQFINALQGLKERLEQSETREQFDDAGRSDRPTDVGHRLLDASATSSTSISTDSARSWYTSPYRITIPQAKPLSPGEILGCTSPKLPGGAENGVDGIIYIGDGRFHLESIMIANPRVPAFRYDPYEKRFMREGYDHSLMRSNRSKAVGTAKDSLSYAANSRSLEGGEANGEEEKEEMRRGWGLVLGTLGRQGSTRVLAHLRSMMAPTRMDTIPILLSELSPQKLALFGDSLVTYVQTSCPRLSIDWGDAFAKPLLSPYEAAVALGQTPGWAPTSEKRFPSTGRLLAASDHIQSTSEDAEAEDYPMDFYSDHSRGPWTPRHGMGVRKGNAKGISNRDLLRRNGGAGRNSALSSPQS